MTRYDKVCAVGYAAFAAIPVANSHVCELLELLDVFIEKLRMPFVPVEMPVPELEFYNSAGLKTSTPNEETIARLICPVESLSIERHFAYKLRCIYTRGVKGVYNACDSPPYKRAVLSQGFLFNPIETASVVAIANNAMANNAMANNAMANNVLLRMIPLAMYSAAIGRCDDWQAENLCRITTPDRNIIADCVLVHRVLYAAVMDIDIGEFIKSAREYYPAGAWDAAISRDCVKAMICGGGDKYPWDILAGCVNSAHMLSGGTIDHVQYKKRVRIAILNLLAFI